MVHLYHNIPLDCVLLLRQPEPSYLEWKIKLLKKRKWWKRKQKSNAYTWISPCWYVNEVEHFDQAACYSDQHVAWWSLHHRAHFPGKKLIMVYNQLGRSSIHPLFTHYTWFMSAFYGSMHYGTYKPQDISFLMCFYAHTVLCINIQYILITSCVGSTNSVCLLRSHGD